MYEAMTRDIRVSVTPQYFEEQSAPEISKYFWIYTIAIENTGDETVHLRTRYWRITNAAGQIEEVRGSGVVGETPAIGPGGSFTYTSGCPLSTPSGIMTGHYGMVSDGGEAFNIEIPAFSLDSPDEQRTLN